MKDREIGMEKKTVKYCKDGKNTIRINYVNANCCGSTRVRFIINFDFS